MPTDTKDIIAQEEKVMVLANKPITRNVQPLTLNLPGRVSNVILLSNRSLLFSGLTNDKRWFYVFNKQKRLTTNVAELNEEKLPDTEHLLPYVALPNEGFITLLNDSLMIWRGDEQQSEYRPLSNEQDSLKVTDINNVFIHGQNDRLIYYVCIKGKNIAFQHAIISIDLRTLHFTINPICIKSIVWDLDAGYLLYFILNLHIFSDGQIIVLARSRSTESTALLSGYIKQNGNIYLTKEITSLEFSSPRISAVSADGKFFAVTDCTPKQNNLHIFKAESLYHWKYHHLCSMEDASFENIHFLESKCIFTAYPVLYSVDECSVWRPVLFSLDMDKSDQKCMPLLPEFTPESGSARTEFFSNRYGIRVVQENEVKARSYTTTVFPYDLDHKKYLLFKKILDLGIDQGSSEIISDYAHELVYKPFFALPRTVDASPPCSLPLRTNTLKMI